MGNHNGKGPHDPAGSPSDFFHTPPNSPSEAFLAAMALPSAASTDKQQTEKPSPHAERTQTLMASSDWSIISTGSVSSSDTKVSDAVAAEETPVVSLESSTALCEGFPSELSWQERDSGMEQCAAERTREDLTLALLGVMEHYKANLRVAPNMDIAIRAEELIRRLITEKEELVEEVDTLRGALKTERLEWHQFQCDLQIAVSVADRLRLEMEEELSFLKSSHRAVEQQLAQALGRQQETERELESLRAENKEICRRLSDFMAQQQQERAELEVLRNICRRKEEKRDQQEDEKKKVAEDFEDKAEDEEEKKQEDGDGGGCDAQKANGSENLELTGKGVAEGYIRSLAALEKKKEEQRVPRRIVMLSERSWSLTRLPLQSNSQESGASKNLSSTLPLCKKEEATKERRGDRLLQRQDSWSSLSTGQQVDNHSSDSIKPQDNFSALLRRHGGSRRNSLLRWSQSQTQGYKNIEITNFSSSWEDGLAFCALYHTYLPADIPYDSLNPAEKKENLELAFRTGAKAGISASLTAEEMLKEGGPDWQKVLGYVERIFRHFEM